MVQKFQDPYSVKTVLKGKSEPSFPVVLFSEWINFSPEANQ